jgi:hypothetical protein
MGGRFGLLDGDSARRARMLVCCAGRVARGAGPFEHCAMRFACYSGLMARRSGALAYGSGTFARNRGPIAHGRMLLAHTRRSFAHDRRPLAHNRRSFAHYTVEFARYEGGVVVHICFVSSPNWYPFYE